MFSAPLINNRIWNQCFKLFGHGILIVPKQEGWYIKSFIYSSAIFLSILLLYSITSFYILPTALLLFHAMATASVTIVQLYNRVGQKYKKSYYDLAQMFSSVKFRAEQFSFSKLFDSRPSSFPKLHFYFYKGIHPKIQREILEF